MKNAFKVYSDIIRIKPMAGKNFMLLTRSKKLNESRGYTFINKTRFFYFEYFSKILTLNNS